MEPLPIVIVSSCSLFVVSMAYILFEARLRSVVYDIRKDIDDIKDSNHEDARKYHEHRKGFNTRIGKLEEKVGHLSPIIERANIENEIYVLQQKLEEAKYRNSILNNTKKSKR